MLDTHHQGDSHKEQNQQLTHLIIEIVLQTIVQGCTRTILDHPMMFASNQLVRQLLV